jgi:hypothetical protein
LLAGSPATVGLSSVGEVYGITAISAQAVLTNYAYTWSQTPKIKYGDSVALVVSQNANSYLKFSSGEWL